MSFLSGDPLPGNKAFTNQLPEGAAPEGYVLDTDFNFIFAALAEIRSAITTLQTQAVTVQTAITSLTGRVTSLETNPGQGGGGGQQTFTLSIATAGSGSTIPAAGPHTYAPGTVASIQANAMAGFVFSGWSGDATGSASPLLVTMNANKAITATFTGETPPPPSSPLLDAGFPVAAHITASTSTDVSVAVPAIGAGRLIVVMVQQCEAPANTMNISGLGKAWTRINFSTYSTYIHCVCWAAWSGSGTSAGNVICSVATNASMQKTLQAVVYSYSNTKDGTSSPLACFGDLEGENVGSDAQIMLDGTVANSVLIGAISWGYGEALTAGASTIFDSTVVDTVTSAFLAAFRWTGTTGGFITFGGSRTTGVNARSLIACEILGP
jgi:hypothetical protein